MTRSESANGRNPHVPPQGDSRPGELDLAAAVPVLKRRWKIIALCPLLIAGGLFFHARGLPPLYTASTLLRSQQAGSPLEAFSGRLPSLSTQDVGAQIEIIESYVILEDVVEVLGLQVRAQTPQPRRAFFQDVVVDPQAPPNRYVLEQQEDGQGLVVLKTLEEGAVAATAPPGGVLEAPGLQLRLSDSIALEDRLEVALVVKEQAVKQLRATLNVEQVRGTPLIRVAYTNPDATLAAAVVAAVAETYQAHNADQKRREAARRRDFIAEQLYAVADSLERARLRQLSYQQRSGTVSPEVEGEALVLSTLDAESRLRTLGEQESSLRALNQALSTPDAGDAALRRTVALGRELIPGAEALYGRLQDLQMERSRLTASRYGYTEEGANVEVVDSLIAATKVEIRRMSDQALEVVAERREAAADQVSDYRDQIRMLPHRSGEYLRLKQQAEAVQNTYDLLAEKYYEAQIAEAVEGGDVEIVDPAVVPVLPDETRTRQLVFLGLLVGLALGLGLAFLADHLDRAIQDSEEAERIAGVPVLGWVPRFRSGMTDGAPRGVLDPEKPSPEAEAFRALKTMLSFAGTKRPRLLAVTSPGPGEGKSTMASNLAASLATNGRVLLIDADFPRPVQHTTFGFDRRPGLSDVLAGDTPIEEAIRRAEGGLSVLPAGGQVPRSSSLLSSGEFRGLLNEMAERFDTVVVDTPPILVIADTTMVASVVDGTLIVVRAGRTERRALAQAAHRLSQASAHVLGLVLNEANRSGNTEPYFSYDYSGYFENGDRRPAALRTFTRIKKALLREQ